MALCGNCNTSGCTGCTGITVQENFCITDNSEINSTLSCGCNYVTVDLCKMYTNGKFVSSDESIDISTFTLPGSTDCGLDFTSNLEFYINGNQVFCPNDINQNELHLEVEAIGAEIQWEGITGSSCKKMIINVTDAALAKALRVGYIGTSSTSWTEIANPNGFINYLWDEGQFIITTDKTDVGLDKQNVVKIQLKADPIVTLNGEGPDAAGNSTITADEPLTVTTTGNNVNIELNYSTSDFEVDAGEFRLLRKEYLKYGANENPVTIDPSTDAVGGSISGDPSWQVAGITMAVWEKEASMGPNITIPYTAPSGYQWVFDANIQIAAYPLFPSSGSGASAVPASGVVQAKAYVNSSLTSDVSGRQREVHPFTIGPSLISRGDGVIKGIFNVPQTQAASFAVKVLLQYSTPSATKATMWRAEFNELSYSGFLRLVKTA